MKGVSAVYFAVAIVGSLVALALAYRRGKEPGSRAIVGIMLGAVAVGFLPLLLLYLVPTAGGVDAVVPPDLAALGLVAIPLGFVYAVSQHQMLGIRRLVRRGTVYIVLSGLLLVLIMFVLGVVGEAWPDTFHLKGPQLVITAAVLVVGAVGFSLLRPQAQRLVDRLIYRDVYDYSEAVRNLAAQAQAGREPRDAVAEMLEQLTRLTQVEGYLVMVNVGVAPVVLGAGGAAARRLERFVQGPGAFPTERASVQYLEGEPVLALRIDENTALWLGPKPGGESFRDDDIKLAEPIGTLIGMLLARSQLTAELRDLNNRLVEAQEEERRRLALELHDGPLQKAIYVSRLASATHKNLAEVARTLATEIRAVTTSLRPPLLDDLGLLPAVEALVGSTSAQHGISIDMDANGFPEEQRLPAAIELSLYRCIQEAIANIVKHAQASRVSVRMAVAAEHVTVEIRDNGVGFDQQRQKAAAAGGHVGLLSLRERARQVGGRLSIDSRKGAGTVVRIDVPLPLHKVS